MRAITRIVGAGAAAVLALSLTACGSDSGSSDAETKAATDTSATPAPEKDDEGDGDSGGEEITAESLYAALSSQVGKDTSYTMTSTTPGAAGTFEGVVVVKDGKTSMSIVSEAAGAKTRIVLTDGAYYLDLGEMSENKFIKIDLSDKSNPFAAMLGPIEDMGDVSKSFEGFKDSVESVEKVGQEDVDGVSTTHYVVTVDPAAALAAVGEGTVPTDAASALEEVSYDLWLDEENRPAKMVIDLAGEKMTTTYSDWGDSSLTVEAPSGDELSPLTWEELMSGGLGG
ncbi:LolA-like protein [Cellulomonas palmilytica]|uniref:hypothetical protein n=1 Tax=Cellulomonas palmilytica TaxID=2608402 RepID=UPI001F382506|nr:hypothetical protein [Cellulomonas palmilytica]UJP40434.1 hypothetical protein F1D97_02580 [Cellulomonas palmilytica]